MVHGQQEHVLRIAHSQQADSKQGTFRQIERTLRLGARSLLDLLFPLRFLQFNQIDHLEGNSKCLGDSLHAASVCRRERGS